MADPGCIVAKVAAGVVVAGVSAFLVAEPLLALEHHSVVDVSHHTHSDHPVPEGLGGSVSAPAGTTNSTSLTVTVHRAVSLGRYF